jgi:hypothetical protein
MNGGLAQAPNYSPALHVKVVRVGPLQVKGAAGNDVQTAKAFNTLVKDSSFAPTTSLVIGMTGRNLIVAVVDANNSETWQFEVQGRNQFGEKISELFPNNSTGQVGAGSATGSKVFTQVDAIIPRILTGDKAAADTVKVGTGDVVGLPFMFSPDLHEILDAELQVANQATAAGKVTVNATNFDSTNMAVKAAAFAASAVVAGDSVQCRVRTDCLTPDDTRRYAVP